MFLKSVNWTKKYSLSHACANLSLVKDLNPRPKILCLSRIMESESYIYRDGWIYSRMLKYLFEASFFSDSYLQHYFNRLYINLLGENW